MRDTGDFADVPDAVGCKLKEQTFYGREKENLIFPVALANEDAFVRTKRKLLKATLKPASAMMTGAAPGGGSDTPSRIVKEWLTPPAGTNN